MASWFGLLQGSHRFFREGFARNNQLGGVKIMEVSWNMESLWFLLVVVIVGRRCRCSMAQFLCHWTGLQSFHSWLSFGYISGYFFKTQLYRDAWSFDDPVATNQYHELVRSYTKCNWSSKYCYGIQPVAGDVLEVSFLETNSSPLKIDGWEMVSPIGNAYFQGLFLLVSGSV